MDEAQHAALMAVAHTLTGGEAAWLMAETGQRWPRLNGAQPADILDHTTDYDMFLDTTEPFFEKYGARFPDIPGMRTAAHLLILMERDLTPGTLMALLQKAGVAEASGRDARASLRLPDGALANSILVVSRAEQSLRAAGVDEADITRFRAEMREHDWDGTAYALIKAAEWVTLVDGYEEPARAPYDPTWDLAVLAVGVSRMDALPPNAVVALANLRRSIGLDSPEQAEAHLRELLRRF